MTPKEFMHRGRGELGITFQQIQKYEKGTNRISAGRLHAIAQLFNVPVATFFEGLPGAPGKANAPDDPCATLGLTRPGIALARAFNAIHDGDARAAIIASAEAFAALSDPAAARRKAA